MPAYSDGMPEDSEAWDGETIGDVIRRMVDAGEPLPPLNDVDPLRIAKDYAHELRMEASEYRVRIVCDDAHARYVLDRFVSRDDLHLNVAGLERFPRHWQTEFSGSSFLGEHRPEITNLDPISATPVPDTADAFRQRVTYRCGACGRNVVLRLENLYDRLELARANGLHEIPLRYLEAR